MRPWKQSWRQLQPEDLERRQLAGLDLFLRLIRRNDREFALRSKHEARFQRHSHELHIPGFHGHMGRLHIRGQFVGAPSNFRVRRHLSLRVVVEAEAVLWKESGGSGCLDGSIARVVL